MSSSRRILGAIVAIGLFSMGSTALLANAGDHDRYTVDQTQYSAGSGSGSGDDLSPARSSWVPNLLKNQAQDRH